jgi:DNA-binding response OmpR family regulator
MEETPKILLVEDDKRMMDATAMIIDFAEYTAVKAYDLKQARAAMKKGGIQAVILDVELPDGNGFDFCRELRKTSAVPVIFYTGRASPEDEAKGSAAGGNGYITKPCDVDDMINSLQAVLAKT